MFKKRKSGTGGSGKRGTGEEASDSIQGSVGGLKFWKGKIEDYLQMAGGGVKRRWDRRVKMAIEGGRTPKLSGLQSSRVWGRRTTTGVRLQSTYP